MMRRDNDEISIPSLFGFAAVVNSLFPATPVTSQSIEVSVYNPKPPNAALPIQP